MNTEVMFSSNTDKWSTPQDFFDTLNEEFHFTLDPCADETNHKCDTYFTKEQDGLLQNWGGTPSSVTHHMGTKKPVFGQKSATRRLRSQTQLLFC